MKKTSVRLMCRFVSLVFVMVLIVAMPISMGNVFAEDTGAGQEISSSDISKTDKKLTPDDVELSDIEWTFDDKYSEEEVKGFKNALEKHGKEGLALAANINNKKLEESDLVWNKEIEKDLKQTNQEIIDMFYESVDKVTEMGFEPDYDNFNLEIQTVDGVGDIVCTQITWKKDGSEETYLQTVNMSMDSEIVGIFIEPTEK